MEYSLLNCVWKGDTMQWQCDGWPLRFVVSASAFLDIFWAINDHLVIGFLMDTTNFEFQPNLCPWQLFKEGNRRGILADFATPFFKLS